MGDSKILLNQSFFTNEERLFCANGNISVSIFKYESGVCAISLTNKKLELIILPYQGQQIWRLLYNGQDQTMSGMFEQPYPTNVFLDNYGAFLLHCGISGMGVPDKDDIHAHHGELPNTTYDSAFIRVGEDEKGKFIAVGGIAHCLKGFTYGYSAEPEIVLYEKETVALVSMAVTNLRNTPLEYMYLCHINFRPQDGARLIYSAPYDNQHVKIHSNIPDSIPSEKRKNLMTYMETIAANPSIHNFIDASTQVYDPEIVMTIRYHADSEGYAHCMQLLPSGLGCYVAFELEKLPFGLRWISRRKDEQAMGMVLPATAEHLGYTYAKSNGQIKVLDGGEKIKFNIKVGCLDKEEAVSMTGKIESVK